VLALNIINEKIYVMMWFWFIALAVITSLYLIYVLAVISVPGMRRVMVERNAKHDIKVRSRVEDLLKYFFEGGTSCTALALSAKMHCRKSGIWLKAPLLSFT
jgi:hypothetical protein